MLEGIKSWTEIIFLLASVVGAFFVYKFRVDRQERDFDQYKKDNQEEKDRYRRAYEEKIDKFEQDAWREIGALRKRLHDHLEDGSKVRIDRKSVV